MGKGENISARVDVSLGSRNQTGSSTVTGQQMIVMKVHAILDILHHFFSSLK